jgi:hypothetical protein
MTLPLDSKMSKADAEMIRRSGPAAGVCAAVGLSIVDLCCYDGFVWTRGALIGPVQRFSARAGTRRRGTLRTRGARAGGSRTSGRTRCRPHLHSAAARCNATATSLVERKFQTPAWNIRPACASYGHMDLLSAGHAWCYGSREQLLIKHV